jgi:acetylornithine deacetylase
MDSFSSSASIAKELIAPLRDDIIRLLTELVRTDTVAIPPQGKEAAGQAVLVKFLRAFGVDTEVYETAFVTTSGHRCARMDRDYSGRRNVLAAVAGSGRGRSVLFNGHMDTVPPGHGKWTGSPWSGALRDGRLYGRGSFDMKGGLAAQFGAICALRKHGVRPGGDVYAESVVDEEWGGGGGTLAARLHGPNPDACLIAEGTQMEAALATRGGAVIDIGCEAGNAAAYFSSGEAVSPAVPIGRLLAWVENWIARRKTVKPDEAYRQFDDPVPVQVLAIEANRFDLSEPFRVPLAAAVRVYFQFLPSENPEQVLTEVRASLEDFQRKDPFFRDHPLFWKPAYDPPLVGHALAADHPWARTFVESASAAMGDPVRVTAAPYPCDAGLVQREFGVPALLFGPRGAGAHNPDEYVEVESVLEAATVLLAATLEWCAA